MSGENSKLASEMIALLKDQIAELTAQNAKLLEEIETMKAEKLQYDSELANRNTQVAHTKGNGQIQIEHFKLVIHNTLLAKTTWKCKATHCQMFKTFSDERNYSTGEYQAKLYLAKNYSHSNGKWTGILFAPEIKKRKIPIACVPPPKYITGFEGIYIGFLNGQVMQFIECIHLLNGIALDIRRIGIDPFTYHSQEQFGQIHRLLGMLTKKATSFRPQNFFDFLRFYPNPLGLIENVQVIYQTPRNEEQIDLLFQWLIKSRPDQKPKFFDFGRYTESLIDKIKEQFIGSTQSANFLIPTHSEYPNFSMENKQTEEVLALYNDEHWHPKQFLVRHPKGNEHLRTEWEMPRRHLMVDELPQVIVAITRIGEF